VYPGDRNFNCRQPGIMIIADQTIRPENCPLSEHRGFFYFCRHFERRCMEDHDKPPEYCRVTRIIVEEEGE